jgi:cell division septation protein DedD
MRPLFFVVMACSLFIGGCAATDSTVQETSAPVAVQEATPAPPPPAELVARVDTIEAAGTAEAVVADSTLAEGEVRFSIQIGAFKEPANASATQARARERYTLPVLNEFQEHTGLYRIRIGSFTTREEAQSHLQRMKTDFPADYKRSFILQLKR